MSNSNKYARGSEWRKWDLHVHTPISIEQEYGGDTDEVWNKYLQTLSNLPADIKVLGINDYLFLEGYERVLKYYQDGNLPNIELLLPIVEFRLKEFVGHEKLKRLNFHIIFADEKILSLETIKQQFLNSLTGKANLSDSVPDGYTWGGVVTKDSLKNLGKHIYENTPEDKRDKKPDFLKIGFNNLNYEHTKIKKALGEIDEPNTFLADKYFKSIGKSEWEDFRWNSAADKKSIINDCHFVFSSSPTVDAAITAKEILINQGVNSRVLHCSDAHQFCLDELYAVTDSKDLGHCYNWIKADCTFEGLRQVLYEPTERLRISETNPILDTERKYFSQLKFGSDIEIFEADNPKEEEIVCITSQEIELNRGLVSIIGGRGEGKSVLIDYLSACFNKNKKKEFKCNEDFLIEYSKTNDGSDILNFSGDALNHALDFIYIPQSEMQEVTAPSNMWRLKSKILSLLRINEKFEENQDLNLEIQSHIRELFQCIGSLERMEKQFGVEDINIHLLEKIKEFDFLISNLSTESTKQLLSDYNRTLEVVSKATQEIDKITKLIESIEAFDYELSESIENLEKPIIQRDLQWNVHIKNRLQSRLNYYLALIQKQNKKKNRITQSISSFYSGDVSDLIANTESYAEKKREIEKEFNDYNTLRESKADFEKNLLESAKKLKTQLQHAQLNINTTWSNFSENKYVGDQKELFDKLISNSAILVEGKIQFNIEEFYRGLRNQINGTVWRKKNVEGEVEKVFKINNSQDYFDFINNKLLSWFFDDRNTYNESFIDYFVNPEYRNKYLEIVPSISYNGKSLSKLSGGEKGTLFLKLSLAHSVFSNPIIIDQPEDEIDNSFIANELTSVLKMIKRYRQVILVTHNANVVVNSDSEQVIVANNNDNMISYKTGSIENPEINSYIKDILEGGKEAFENRMKKYNY